MAIVYQNGIKIASGFNVLDPVPLDARTVVTLISDLTGTLTSSIVFEGMLVYVVEDRKYYSWNGTDHTDIANWLPLSDSSDVQTLLDDKYDKTGGPIGGNVSVDPTFNVNIQGGDLDMENPADNAKGDLKNVDNIDFVSGQVTTSLDLGSSNVINTVPHIDSRVGGNGQAAYSGSSAAYSAIGASKRPGFTFLVENSTTNVINEYIWDVIDQATGNILVGDGDERLKGPVLQQVITPTIDVGGVLTGSVLNINDSIGDILKTMLEKPVDASVTITSSLGPFEKGDSQVDPTFLYVFDNGTHGIPTTRTSTIGAVGSTDISVTNQGSTFDVDITVNYADGHTATDSKTTYFYVPQFFGTSSAATLTYTSMSNLLASFDETKVIQSSSLIQGTFSASNEYVYFISNTNSLKVKDGNGFINNDWQINTRTMLLLDGSSETVYEYRTLQKKTFTDFDYELVTS